MTPISIAVMPEGDLRRKIQAEYREMPALCLTTLQAARLMQIEYEHCARAMQDLERSGFLHRVGDRFFRSDSGRY